MMNITYHSGKAHCKKQECPVHTVLYHTLYTLPPCFTQLSAKRIYCILTWSLRLTWVFLGSIVSSIGHREVGYTYLLSSRNASKLTHIPRAHTMKYLVKILAKLQLTAVCSIWMLYSDYNYMGNNSITKPSVNDAEQKCKDAKITHLNQICMFGKQGRHTIKY